MAASKTFVFTASRDVAYASPDPPTGIEVAALTGVSFPASLSPPRGMHHGARTRDAEATDDAATQADRTAKESFIVDECCDVAMLECLRGSHGDSGASVAHQGKIGTRTETTDEHTSKWQVHLITFFANFCPLLAQTDPRRTYHGRDSLFELQNEDITDNGHRQVRRAVVPTMFDYTLEKLQTPGLSLTFSLFYM